MNYKKEKLILISVIGFLLSFSFASAKNFTIYNATDINQPYFSVNGVSGNVGIGTTTPGAALEIIKNGGTGGTTMLQLTSNDTWGNGFYINNSSTNGHNWLLYSYGQNSGQAGNFSIYDLTSTANRLTINTSGNIGMGITNPSYKLDVNGAAQFTQPIIVGTPTIGSNAATKSYVDSAAMSAANSFWTASGNNIYNSNSGNVGIGTTNPGSKLDINGNTLFRGGASIQYADANVDLGSPWMGTGLMIQNTSGTAGTLNQLSFLGNSGFYAGGIVNELTVANGTETKMHFVTRNGGIYGPRMTIDKNGNLGVGTTNPTERLVIAGATLYNNGMKITGNSTGGVGFSLENTSAGGHKYAFFSGGSSNTVGAGGFAIYDETSSTYPMSFLANGEIHIGRGFANPTIFGSSSGDVGIGTTTPANADGWAKVLDVYGVSHAKSIVTTNNGIETGTYSHNTGFFGAPAGGIIGTRSNHPLSLITNSATRMTILTNGNVGIGTTTPSYKLDVAGTAQFSQPVLVGTPTAAGHATTKSYVDSAAMSAANSFWTASGNNIYNSNSGNIGIGTTQPFSKLFIRGADNQLTLNTDTHNSGTTTLRFKLSTDSSDNQSKVAIMATALGSYGRANLHFVLNDSIDSSNATIADSRLTILSGGNVGIGTTNPGAKLSIINTTNRDALWISAGTSTAINTGPKIVFNQFNSSYPTWRQAEISSSFTGSMYGSDLIFSTHAEFNDPTIVVERMRITSSGNIGIGTSTPGTALEVQSTNDNILRLRQSGGGWNYIEFYNDTARQGYFGIASNGNDFQFSPAGNTIIPSGNLGVGTSTPVYRLDVAGTAQFSQPVIVGTPTAAGHATTKSYVDSVAGGGIGSGTLGQTLRHNGTSWVADSNLYNNGTNVGIGNTNPDQRLEIRASATGTNPFKISGSSNEQRGMSIGFTGDTENEIVFNRLISDLPEVFMGASRLNGGNVYFPNGNVGIGTTVPSEKLSVANGMIGVSLSNGIRTISDNNHSIIFRPNGGDNSINYYEYGGTLASGLGHKFFTGGAYASQSLKMQIANDGVYIAGNVGVGTATTTEKLTLYGPPDALSLQTGGLSTRFIFTTNWAAGSGDYLGIRNSSVANPQLLLNSTGNVGINTTTPSYKLDVAGAAQFSQPVLVGTPTAAGHATTKSYVDSAAMSAANSFWTASGNNIYNSNSGNIGIGVTNPTAKLDVVPAIMTFNGIGGLRLGYSTGINPGLFWERTGTKMWYQYLSGNDLIIGENTAAQPYDRVTFQQGGNVGIGTTNPAVKLDITGSIATRTIGTEDEFHLTRSVNSGVSNVQLAAFKLGTYSNSGTNPATRLDIDLKSAGDNNLTADKNVMTLLDNGNVGIGKTNPGAKLNIHSWATGGTFANANQLYIQSDNWGGGAGYGMEIGYYYDWPTQYGGRIQVKNAGVGGILALNPDAGNVGIGTTTPSYKLDVAGTAQFSQPVLVGTPTAGSHATTKSYVDSAAMSAANSFWTANGSNIYNSNSGSVGIGTTNPGRKLEILGAASTTPLMLSFSNGNTVNNYTGMVFSGETPKAGILFASNGAGYARGSLIFATSNSMDYSGINLSNERMRITDGGLVGIGTTPNAMLHVRSSVAGTGGLVVDGVANLPFKVSTYGNENGNVGAFTVLGASNSPRLNLYDTSSVSKVQISGTLDSYFNGGNVGIGTSTPAAKLHLATSPGASVLRVAGNNPAYYMDLVPYVISGGNYGYIFKPYGFAGYADGLVIDTVGNVGIGTTTPSYKLDVAGTSQFSQPVLVGTPTAAGHATTKSYVDSVAGGGIGSGTLGQTLRHNGTNWVADSNLYNNGTNVGIGTVSPGAYKLAVNGSAIFGDNTQDSQSITVQGVNYASAKFTNSTNTYAMGIRAGGTFSFTNVNLGATVFTLASDATANRISVNANNVSFNGSGGGSVGVGWSNAYTIPSRLTVVGNGLTSGTSSFDVQNASNTSMFYVRDDGAVAVNNKTQLNTDSTRFYVAGSLASNTTAQETVLRLYRPWQNSVSFAEVADFSLGKYAAGQTGTQLDIKLANGGVGGAISSGAADMTVMSLLSNGNVGIGTTTPEYKLDVAGTAQFSQPVLVGTPTAAGHATTKSYVDSAAMSAANSFWTASGNNIYNSNSGNIGIGTTTPNQKLSLSVGNVDGIKITSSNAPVLRLYSSAASVDSRNWQFASNWSATGDFQFLRTTTNTGDPGTVVWSVNKDGNMGIGTNGPVSKLQIHDGITTLSSSNVVHGMTGFFYQNTYGNLSILNSSNGGFNISGISDTDATGLYLRGVIGSETPAASTPAINLVAQKQLTTGAIIQSLGNTETVLGISNGTTRLLSVLGNGNVGIGTTNPSGKLDVSGLSTTAPSATITAGDLVVDTNNKTVYIGRLSNMGGDNTKLIVRNRIGQEAMHFDPDGSGYTYIGSPYTYLSLGASTDGNGTERMRIVGSTGYVGINTTTPAYKLDVAGTAQFSQPVIVGSPTIGGHAATKSYVDSAAMSAANSFWTASGNNIYSSNSGNVGIGTASPNAKLELLVPQITATIASTTDLASSAIVINGNGGTDGTKVGLIGSFGNSGAISSGLVFGRQGTSWGTYVALHTHPDNSNNTKDFLERMRIDMNGNVGIGTITPAAKLDVLGSLKTDSGSVSTDGVGNITFESFLDKTNSLYKLDPSNSSTSLNVAGSIYSTSGMIGMSGTGNNYLMGNLGLGTTNPSPYKLYVDGSAYMTGSLTFAASSTLSIPGGTLTVNKLTVNTIDPLYNIKGVNYSTFAPSIVGGVKEEVTGKLKISKKVASEFQTVIDFSQQEIGSDLWVWYNVIDFNESNVEAFVTPYGSFANVYYTVSDDKITFHADRPTNISYRLIAKRHDWREWPTKANNQQEKAGFIIK